MRNARPEILAKGDLQRGQCAMYEVHGDCAFAVEPIMADTFAEADRNLEPFLGRPLTEFLFRGWRN